MKLLKIAVTCLAFLFIVGCSDSDDVNSSPTQAIPPTSYTFVHFNPASGNPAELTLPNDILRNPVTGQNAVPSLGDPAVDALVAQFNSISGFSTSGPIIIPFIGRLNQDTVNNQTLLVADTVDLAAAAGGAQVNPFKEITWQVITENGNDKLVGFPVRPLTPGRTHVVIVTQGLRDNINGFAVESEGTTIFLKRRDPLVDADGNSVVSVLTNAQAQSLEPLRQAYGPVWQAAESVTGQDRLSIPFAFAFTTQQLFGTLADLKEKARSTPASATIQRSFVGTAAVDAFFQGAGLGGIPHNGIGALHFGTISMPYYIHDPADPLGPITGSFSDSVEGTVVKGTVEVPFIAALPVATIPVPALIFQHGITRQKEDVFGIANTVCANGAGVIAIDLVLHGERTFGLDVLSNNTGAPGPDGVPDPSGSSFINLTNLLASRDNVRQSVADLYRLTHMITSQRTDFDNNGVPDFLPIGLSYVGVSLGGIVGGTFVATEENVSIANLNVAGGRIPYLLQNSESFGPRIDAGLAAAGIVRGTFLYDLFFMVTQTITDDADPFNYAPGMFSGANSAGVPTSILMQEMIGDTVVPNSATEDLARAMNIPQVDAIVPISGLPQVGAPHIGSGLFQVDIPNHGCLLDPTCAGIVGLQTQSLTYIGTAILQGAPTIINPFGGKTDQTIPVSKLPAGMIHHPLGVLQFFPQK